MQTIKRGRRETRIQILRHFLNGLDAERRVYKLQDNAAMALQDLFPPIDVNVDDDVDIVLDEDLCKGSIKDEIEAYIHVALDKWNKLDPAAASAELGPSVRTRRMRETVSELYSDNTVTMNTPHIEAMREIVFQTPRYEDLFHARTAGTTPCHALLEGQGDKKRKQAALTFTRRSSEQEAPISPGTSVYQLELHHAQAAIVQKMQVLGSQPLSVVSDALYCATNDVFAQEQCHSNYFFIGGRFFRDERRPGMDDYTAPIRAWLGADPERRRKYRAQLEEPVGRTDQVTLDELKLELNEPYVYGHQGNCEHRIVCTAIRLHHPQEDPGNRHAYPLRMVWVDRSRRQKCCVCNLFSAKRICVDDELASTNPTYFCERCFFQAHYAKDGHLVKDNFKVFPFIH